MRTEIKSYEDLEVWQLGIELSLRAYRVVGVLPSSERYELSPQIGRCAVSIPANIAEGHARRRPKPYLNDVNDALGSLAEWITYLVIADRLGYISRDRFEREKREADRLGQMLHALARSLESRLQRVNLGLALSGFSLCAIASGAFLAFRQLRSLDRRVDVFTLPFPTRNLVLSRIDIDVLAHGQHQSKSPTTRPEPPPPEPRREQGTPGSVPPSTEPRAPGAWRRVPRAGSEPQAV